MPGKHLILVSIYVNLRHENEYYLLNGEEKEMSEKESLTADDSEDHASTVTADGSVSPMAGARKLRKMNFVRFRAS